MENVEKQIEFIEEMMATAKGNLENNSIFYLIWGWLVFAAAISNYYLFTIVNYEYHWVAWPILMSIGGVASIFAGMKQSKEQRVKTKIDKMLQYLWLGFTITIVVMLSGMGQLGISAVYPMVIALYGLGTFVSGSILNYTPLKVGAVAAWVCASIAFYKNGFSDQLILIAVAILFSYIIPGHLLRIKK